MLDFIKYNGELSYNIGDSTIEKPRIIISSPPVQAYPKKIYETIAIPGRNGDLKSFTGRYENTSRAYNISVLGPDYEKQVANLMEWLNSGEGYVDLSDSFEPNVIRQATYEQTTSVADILNQAGSATLTFNCNPQRFYGLPYAKPELQISSSGVITIPPQDVLFDLGSPIMTLNEFTTSEDGGYITINMISDGITYGIKITAKKGTHKALFIDSDIKDVYHTDFTRYDPALINIEVSPSFPLIKKEAKVSCSTVSLTGTTLEVNPRWYRI